MEIRVYKANGNIYGRHVAFFDENRQCVRMMDKKGKKEYSAGQMKSIMGNVWSDFYDRCVSYGETLKDVVKALAEEEKVLRAEQAEKDRLAHERYQELEAEREREAAAHKALFPVMSADEYRDYLEARKDDLVEKIIAECEKYRDTDPDTIANNAGYKCRTFESLTDYLSEGIVQGIERYDDNGEVDCSDDSEDSCSITEHFHCEVLDAVYADPRYKAMEEANDNKYLYHTEEKAAIDALSPEELKTRQTEALRGLGASQSFFHQIEQLVYYGGQCEFDFSEFADYLFYKGLVLSVDEVKAAMFDESERKDFYVIAHDHYLCFSMSKTARKEWKKRWESE